MSSAPLMRLCLLCLCLVARSMGFGILPGGAQVRARAAVRMSTAEVVATSGGEMKLGDFTDVKFRRESGSKQLGKYTIEATIKKSDMNSFLEEYKGEMARRKVVFPGFRAGKLPPYVMGDVRKYLVCFGLETMLGQLCNLNSLQMCSAEGNEVAFGEDSYYEEIIKTDFRGYDFTKQRDAWREGTDFSFAAEFFAISEEDDEEEEEEAGGRGVVVDAELVEGGEDKK